MASLKVLFLFLLPLILSHLLISTVADSASGSGGPPDILLPSAKLEQAGRVKMPWFPFRFYWQDTSSGPDPSAVVVAQSSIKSSTSFGLVRVMDDPLTIGPSRSSLLIGKSQGIYVSADKETVGLLMVMTLTFSVGEFAGSSLTVVGRNQLNLTEREMPITGGTGLFRFATGYVRVRTQSYDPTNSYTVVEYNCYFN